MSLRQIIIASAIALSSCAANRKIVKVNDNTFREYVLGSSKPTIVEFYTESCNLCQLSEPIYEKVANEYRQLNFVVYDCESGNFCNKLGINGVPTYSIFRDGIEISRNQGYLDEDSLEDFIGSSLNK